MEDMPWDIIAELDEWLDHNVGVQYLREPLAQDAMRLTKIGEEFGEAIAAFIAFTGQNPRKPELGSKLEFLSEVIDTMITCVLCVEHFTKQPQVASQLISERWIYRKRSMEMAKQAQANQAIKAEREP